MPISRSKSKQPLWLFVRVLGRRSFWAFLLVTILTAGILAATNIVSKYAIKVYTEDQLKHVSWDAVVYQNEDLPDFLNLAQEVSRVEGVEDVQNLGLLRVHLTPEMPIELGGQNAYIPWFTVMSATDPAILPPELRSQGGEVVLALLGPQKIIKPYLDRVTAGSSITVRYLGDRTGGELEIFSTQVQRVVQVNRQELVKWIMREIGSVAFIPQQGVIVVLPMDEFVVQTARFTQIFRELEVPEFTDVEVSHELTALFTPEIDHLVSVDRNRIVSGWDLVGSRDRAAELMNRVHAAGEGISFGTGVNSDLLITLDKMAEKSRLVGLASILIAIPILWMAWVFAWNLAGLISLNERRTIGLFRLRGASSSSIERGFITAIGSGGLMGGMVGIVVGTGIPLIAYQLNGSEIPFALMHRVQEPWSLALFIIVSTLLGLLAGKRVTDYATRITPSEAALRVASSEGVSFSPQLSWFQLLALVLGTYKLVAWIVGFSPEFEPLQSIDSLLGFIGAPLFIYGFAAFVVSSSGVLRGILTGLVSPIAGRLQGYVIKNLMLRPHRVASAVLIAALMFCVSFYPTIMADSFYDKVMRGVQVNVGSALALVFPVSELTGGEIRVETVRKHLSEVRGDVERMVSEMKEVEGVAAIQTLFEMSVPGVYVEGLEGLPLYLLTVPEDYLETVYYENELGIGRPFSRIIREMGDDLVVSKGFASYSDLSVGSMLNLGRSASGGDVAVQVAGVVSHLPGAPQLLLQDREAYVAAEVDFIDHLANTNPFLIAYADNAALEELETLLSEIVLLIDVDKGLPVNLVIDRIEQAVGDLPFRYESIRSLSEEMEQVGKDMFTSLALENIKVYMIGGIFVALAGIMAIGITNFVEERRSLALLRVRGASPIHQLRISLSSSFAPVLVGAVVGVCVGLLAGFGLAKQLFTVAGTQLGLQALPVHLVLSRSAFITVGVLVLFFAVMSVSFSLLVFRKTAREALREE